MRSSSPGITSPAFSFHASSPPPADDATCAPCPLPVTDPLDVQSDGTRLAAQQAPIPPPAAPQYPLGCFNPYGGTPPAPATPRSPTGIFPLAVPLAQSAVATPCPLPAAPPRDTIPVPCQDAPPAAPAAATSQLPPGESCAGLAWFDTPGRGRLTPSPGPSGSAIEIDDLDLFSWIGEQPEDQGGASGLMGAVAGSDARAPAPLAVPPPPSAANDTAAVTPLASPGSAVGADPFPRLLSPLPAKMEPAPGPLCVSCGMLARYQHVTPLRAFATTPSQDVRSRAMWDAVFADPAGIVCVQGLLRHPQCPGLLPDAVTPTPTPTPPPARAKGGGDPGTPSDPFADLGVGGLDDSFSCGASPVAAATCLFTPKQLASCIGTVQADVINQDPNAFGLGMSNLKSERMSVRAFVKYMSTPRDHAVHLPPPPPTDGMCGCYQPSSFAPSKGHKQARTKFCVNVDIGDVARLTTPLKAGLPATIVWQGPQDMLRLCRQDISGVTSPQIYLKSPGVWTGGHEENLRLFSVNVNHGPSASEWYAVSPRHVPLLQRAVKAECGLDITAGGCWFPSLQFCEDHGVPVMFGVQEPGDVVVLDGATAHWVRGRGLSVHSSWNLAPTQDSVLVSALTRRAINAALVPAYPSIVPLNTLMYDASRHVVSSHCREGGNKRPRPISRNLTDVAVMEFANRLRSSRFVEAGDALAMPPTSLLRLLMHQMTLVQADAAGLAAAVDAAGIPTLPEPEYMNVSMCQSTGCFAELFSQYIACSTCEDKVCSDEGAFIAIAPGRTDLAAQYQDDTPLVFDKKGRKRKEEGEKGRKSKKRAVAESVSPYLCVPCGIRHRQATGHTAVSYTRVPLSDIASLCQDFSVVAQTLTAAYSALHVLE